MTHRVRVHVCTARVCVCVRERLHTQHFVHVSMVIKEKEDKANIEG